MLETLFLFLLNDTAPAVLLTGQKTVNYGWIFQMMIVWHFSEQMLQILIDIQFIRSGAFHQCI